MGIGGAARGNDSSVFFCKILRFCGKLRSISNQQRHLSANCMPAQPHYLRHHPDGLFAKNSSQSTSSILQKWDAVHLAYWKESGKQHECPAVSIKSPVNVQHFLVSTASSYHTKSLETMWSISCRYSILPPALSTRFMVNCGAFNNISFSEVLGAHVMNRRLICTNFDKESCSAEERKNELPRSLDDFQHEEIVGPTVEKDLSTTAQELRDCLEKLTKSMSDLASAYKALAFLQLAIALWCGIIVSPNHHTLLIINIAGAVLAMTLAYFIRQAQKSILFFSKLEERSRLRIITLSVQVIKAFLAFTGQSNGVIRVVSVGVFLTLLLDIWLLYGNQFL